MPPGERSLYRVGGGCSVVGAILSVVFNVLHPRFADIRSTETQLAETAGSALWIVDHLGILLGVVLMTAGLVALARSMQAGPGAGWARLGLAGAVVGAALMAVLMATDGIALKDVADAWARTPAAERGAALSAAHVLRQVNLALLSVWTTVFLGVTILSYGLAVAASGIYPAWLGWVGVLGGIGSLGVGLAMALAGPTVLVNNVLFLILSLLITLWALALGVLLWRRAGG